MTGISGLHNAVPTIAGILAILLLVRYAQAAVAPFSFSLFIAIIMAMPVGWSKKQGLSISVSIGIALLATIVVATSPLASIDR